MSDDTLIVEVSDTGMGIPEDKMVTLIGPFIKAESDPQKSREGNDPPDMALY
jgi:signal transduction histidine kinase